MLFKQFARFETNLLLVSISNNLSDFYILQKRLGRYFEKQCVHAVVDDTIHQNKYLYT